jgi:hypothetical protein
MDKEFVLYAFSKIGGSCNIPSSNSAFLLFFLTKERDTQPVCYSAPGNLLCKYQSFQTLRFFLTAIGEGREASILFLLREASFSVICSRLEKKKRFTLCFGCSEHLTDNGLEIFCSSFLFHFRHGFLPQCFVLVCLSTSRCGYSLREAANIGNVP